MHNLSKQVVNYLGGLFACLSPVFSGLNQLKIIQNHKLIYDCMGDSQIFFINMYLFPE